MSTTTAYTPSPALQALLTNNRFVRLTDSHSVFPDALGSGLPLLQVVTDECHALIALQGAQLLSFQPLDKPALLWLSPNCDFSPGRALRGGVPLCLPWFGPHPQDASKPKHGFARNQDWTLLDARLLASGDCQLEFGLHSHNHPDFPQAFEARLSFTLGQRAQLTLSLTNRDPQPARFTWALHSYHPVAQLANTRVLGLKGKTYRDNLAGLSPHTQTDELTFTGEVDRVFPGVDNPLQITGEPSIDLTHDNCPSVIVWNPGATNAAAIGDIGPGNEQGFICVERGAVLDEAWELAPNETRRASLTLAAIVE